MTQRDELLKQCEYLANVFMAIFPKATMVTVDATMPENYYATIYLAGYDEPQHYLMAVDSDDDDYHFEPEDDNHDDYRYSAIRFPLGNVLPVADDDPLPMSDGSLDQGLVNAVTLRR